MDGMLASRRFRGPIDLHTHSTVSDGTESPAEVARAAARAGLGTFALTDHDSTDGWPAAASVATREGLTFIPGMELSARLDGVTVHILAYLIDSTNAELAAEIELVRHERLLRAQRIVESLRDEYLLVWDDVLAQTTPGSTIGRPHIADALVARGHAPTRSAAFATILHWQSGYYQPHYAPDPLRAVRLIRAAGGVPVLAHPAARGREWAIPSDQLEPLIAAGLAGVEIEHRENTPEGKKHLRELAERYDLIVTGSSDYHGSGKPNRLAENLTDAASLDRIIAEATGTEPVYA